MSIELRKIISCASPDCSCSQVPLAVTTKDVVDWLVEKEGAQIKRSDHARDMMPTNNWIPVPADGRYLIIKVDE